MKEGCSPKILAVIPARSGSKGIPQKNLQDLAGKPLVAHTILAALNLDQIIDRIIVSTDCSKTAEVARDWGAEVPFLRPSKLAQDDSPMIDVVIHMLDWLLQHQSYTAEYVLLLQPTSPLRTSEDILKAIDLLKQKKAHSLVSVCPVLHHPFLMKKISGDGTLSSFMDHTSSVDCRQELPPLYCLNGALYLTHTQLIREKQKLYDENALGFIMPINRSLDIDSPWDLQMANFILKEQKYRESL